LEISLLIFFVILGASLFKERSKTIPYEPVNLMIGYNTLQGVNNPNLPLKIYTMGDLTELDDNYDLSDLKRLAGENTLIDCLIHKESSWRVDAVGDNGHSFGLLQFQVPTFNEFATKYGLDININNPEHQIILAKLMIEDGYLERWTTHNQCQN